MRKVSVMVACVMLTACGGTSESDSAANDAAVAETGGTAVAPASKSDDKKMRAALADPCAFLPKEAVAAAAGTGVDRVNPLPATKADDVDAECQYSLQDGGSAAVDVTYNFLFPQYFDAAEIKSRRDVSEGTATDGKKFEDVAGVGDVAYYDPNREQLTVFRGTAEQVIFRASKRRDGDSKAITTAMAKAAGY